MSEAFKSYVTSAAFNLTLSKPMIECLSQIHGRGESWASLGTAVSLERRGLVKREEFKGGGEYIAMRLTLTDVGRMVIPLLKASGLLTEYPPLPEYKTSKKTEPLVSVKEANHD